MVRFLPVSVRLATIVGRERAALKHRALGTATFDVIGADPFELPGAPVEHHRGRSPSGRRLRRLGRCVGCALEILAAGR
jgi:hypothetical protein